MSDPEPEPTHPCPATLCPREVPDHLLMCGIHWRMVQHSIQRAVNRAYDHGAGAAPLPCATPSGPPSAA
jgi:hypothetical protein